MSIVIINGRHHDVSTRPLTVADVVPLAGGGAGVAVAVNGVVVPRSAWPATPVLDADLVEVVTAVQGG